MIRRISRILLFTLLAACSGGPTGATRTTLTLLLDTADGLREGDAIYLGADEIGRIVELKPSGGRVEAVARLNGSVRISSSARFELVRVDRTHRLIRVSDESPAGRMLISGEKVQVDLPRETMEDRLWISK